MTRLESNSTEGTTTSYISRLDSSTCMTQTYTFYRQAHRGSFGGVNFTVAAARSSGLSTYLESNESISSRVTAARKNGFTLRYGLFGFSLGSAGRGKVERKRDTPQKGITTFAVSLVDDVVGQVEVLNDAIIDGVVTTLGQSTSYGPTLLVTAVGQATPGADLSPIP